MNILTVIITSEEMYKAAKTAGIALILFGYIIFLSGSMDIVAEKPKGIQISVGVEHPFPEK